jgi:hypothetical protein
MPSTVAYRARACTIFTGSDTGIMGSNPTRGMDVCVCVVLGRSDLPPNESYRLCIGLRNWKSGQGRTKGCRAIIIKMKLSLGLIKHRALKAYGGAEL